MRSIRHWRRNFKCHSFLFSSQESQRTANSTLLMKSIRIRKAIKSSWRKIFFQNLSRSCSGNNLIRSRSLTDRMEPSEGSGTGSIPVGSTREQGESYKVEILYNFLLSHS